MRKITVLALIILVASMGMGHAKENTINTGSTILPRGLKPIEVQTFSTGKCTTGVGYYYEGLPLQDTKDYERVIDPLQDTQASRMIRSSADKDAWGSGLFWGGLGVELAGWADFTAEMTGMEQTTTGPSGIPTTSFHDPDLGPSIALVVAGNIGWVTGMLLQGDAGTDRYNAVNRYNYQVQQDNTLSMSLYTQPHAAGLDFTGKF
jgi:hypothetical protein